MKLNTYCRPDYALVGLRDLIQELPPSVTMVEVGSFAGESAEEFLKHEKILHLHAVDPWQNGYDPNDPASSVTGLPYIEAEFDFRMKAFPSRWTKHRLPSDVAVKNFKDRSLDFVYIDAVHTFDGVISDITYWLPKVRIGGFIGGHDYDCTVFPGVVKAVNKVFGSPDKTFSEHSWIKAV